MFGIGMPEMLLILAVALIVIGPKKLPDLAKSLGRAFSEFKRATAEFKESIEIDPELKDVKTTFDDMRDNFKDAIDFNVDFESEHQSTADAPDEKKSEGELRNSELKKPDSDG